MKLKYIFILCCIGLSCTNSGSNIPTNSKINGNNSIPIDSIDYWVSLSYLNTLDSAISICDCWRENKYHFLSFDTIKMELFLKSNLIHYGHDSEIILPIKKSNTGYKFDSTLSNWPVSSKEFVLLTNDTLKLEEEGKEFIFIRKSYSIRDKQPTRNKINYSDIVDLFYKTNSQLLLKYTKTDQNRSDTILIAPDTLKELITNGFVRAHCSDDFHFDGITIKKDSMRYFQLQFTGKEVMLFELANGRNKNERIDLNTLPKQVMIINKN